MRRALLAVLAGGLLLTGAACDSDAEAPSATAAPTTAPASSSPPPPDYSANTKVVCGKLQSIYTVELRDFGAALGKTITYRETKQSAEAKKAEDAAVKDLREVAAKIRKETAAAENPEFKAAGLTSAAKIEASAVNRTYVTKVKTLKDLNSTIEAQYKEWLSPVAGYCAA